MKRKAVLLSILVVLSTMVAGVGASATAAGPAQQAPEPAQQTAPQTNDSETTGTQTASQPEPTQAGAPPYPVDIPPSQLANGSVDTSTLPETMQSNGEYAVQTNVGTVTRSAGDAERRPSPQYEVGGPQLRWPSLDATGGDGPGGATGSAYYFKNYTLRVVSPSVEIWVANNLSYPAGDPRPTPEITQAQLLYLADEFTNNIEPKESQLYRDPVAQYGTDSPLYGSSLPDDYYQSADNQSRTVLLVDNVRDNSYYDSNTATYIAGFFSPIIGQFTDRNVMVIDSNDWDDRLGDSDAPWKQDAGDAENESAFGIESTTAHEYQHLLHSYEDPDETTWINEGLAEVTPYRVGYGVPSSIQFYERYPSNSLIEWEDQVDEAPVSILADYGGAGLFQLYGSEQFGVNFTQAVFNDPANGIESVENSLDDVGTERDFYSFYQDFSTALLTDGLTTQSDRHQIEAVDFDANTSEVINTRDNLTAAYGNAYEPLELGDSSINGFNVSGIQYPESNWETAPDPTGESTEPVLWSTSGNNLDNWAIFDADLTGTENPTLAFDTYYDIERGFDYGFVQISTDGGETWTSLENQNTTSYRASPTFLDPTVEANLPGFTGISGGNLSDNSTANDDATWVTEEFGLSNYTDDGGVLIAFRYVTDPASVKPGFYVRNISVSGTDASYSGASEEPFISIREAQEDYIEYQYSFVGIREDNSTEVVQLPKKTFENGSPMALSQFPTGEFEQTIFTVTWAPETRDTGTVPYGYEVNPSEQEPPQQENTLRIEGTGEYAFYSLRATGDVEGRSTTAEDTVSGSTATGAVGPGTDTFTFEGELRNLYVQEGARVFLNGERINPDDYESVVSFAGDGSYSSYTFTVKNGAITDTQGLTREDEVSIGGDAASGAVRSGTDSYTFTGTFRGLDTDGDASVILNGQEVNPRVFYNTITFRGFGTYTAYEFTVTGEVKDGISLTQEDSFEGNHGEGAVRNGADTFVYSGTLEDLTIDSKGKEVAVRNGERVREEQVDND